MRHARAIIAAAIVLAALSPAFMSAGGLAATDASAVPLAGRSLSVDSGFRPSVDGYAFKNSFADADDNWLVKLGGGRCGGMAYASLDHFYAEGTPGSKSGDGTLIARRNIDSLVGNGARFVLWTAWSTATRGVGPGITDISRREELPLLARQLEDGPVPLGLVRTQRLSDMKQNHQVVAYAIEADETTARISIYDPNHPTADDVVVVVPLSEPDAPVVSLRGTAPYAQWTGFFVERYAPAEPLR